MASLRLAETGKSEKMEAVWAKREHQIGQAVRNMAGLYGDVKGLLGGHIEIRGLALEAPETILPVERDRTDDPPRRPRKQITGAGCLPTARRRAHTRPRPGPSARTG